MTPLTISAVMFLITAVLHIAMLRLIGNNANIQPVTFTTFSTS